jgi:putative SOS response-associated peptidase YedK
MIERYSLSASPEQVGAYFGVDPHGFDKPLFNAAPGQLLPVITMKSEGLSHFYWGMIPQRAQNKSIAEKIINIRQEMIEERPVIKKKIARYRCAVPADGFYVWKKLGKKTTVPHRFELQNKGLFSMAALWEEYDDENGEIIHTFTLITQPASRWVESVHDRMPAILDLARHRQWLSAENEADALAAIPEAQSTLPLNHYTVSPRINSTSNNDPTLVIPTPSADQFGNLTLFD